RPPVPPPAPVPPEPQPDASANLRELLVARAVGQPSLPPASTPAEAKSVAEKPQLARKRIAAPAPAMAPPPPQAPAMTIMDAAAERAEEEVAVNRSQVRQEPMQQVGIAPPPSWRPPPVPPDSPSALAGGYDLEFDSLRRETLRSGGGARRVLLFAETW